MAGSLNKVLLIGYVGADPEIRQLNNGGAVATVSIATTERWKDKNTSEQREKTEWNRVVFFDPLASIVEKYVKKGSQLFVEGKLRTRKWQDSSGTDKYTTEVVVSVGGNMVLLGGNTNQMGGNSNQVRDNNTKEESSVLQGKSNGSLADAELNDMLDDDIPF